MHFIVNYISSTSFIETSTSNILPVFESASLHWISYRRPVWPMKDNTCRYSCPPKTSLY